MRMLAYDIRFAITHSKTFDKVNKESSLFFRILFSFCMILGLRPRLKAGRKQSLSRKELTEFVEKVILGLKEELYDEYLTECEYYDYVRLFRFAVDRDWR